MNFSDYIVYADESGDHSLTSINPPTPAFAPGMLEIQVTEVHAGAEQLAEGALQASGVQAAGAQQAVLGRRQCVISHGLDLGVWRRPGKAAG